MPKMKTKKAASKRFKVRSGGSIKRGHATKRHILTIVRRRTSVTCAVWSPSTSLTASPSIVCCRTPKARRREQRCLE